MHPSARILLSAVTAVIAGGAGLFLSLWLTTPFIDAGDSMLGRGPYALRASESAAFTVAIAVTAFPIALIARHHAAFYGLLAGLAASGLMATAYHLWGGDVLSPQYSSFFLFEIALLLLVFPVLSALWARLMRANSRLQPTP